MPRKLIKSFKYAGAGAQHALKTQRNLWIHIFIGLMVIGWAAGLGVSRLEMAVLVLAVMAVMVAEMFNTAVEEMINLLSPEQRLTAGLVKNLSAGAVLLAALGSLAIGCIIFLPRLIK